MTGPMSESTAKPPADQTKLIARIIAVAIIGMLAITLGPKLFHKVRDQRLMQTGTAAPGVITGLDETGDYVNREPEIEITVEVTPAEGEPFTAKTVKVLGPLDLKRYEVGAKVDVRYDPDSHRIALVGLASQ
jgi:hypothetical protein